MLVSNAGGDSEGQKYIDKFNKLSPKVKQKLTDYINENLNQPSKLGLGLLSKIKEEKDNENTSAEDKSLLKDIPAGAGIATSAIVADIIMGENN